MKQGLVFLAAVLLFLVACESEPPKLELKESNVFAFNLGDAWEVNGSTNIHGFDVMEDEETDMNKAKLSYTVDLITPEQDTLWEVDYGLVNHESDEEIQGVELDVQFELDTTFAKGTYTMIFNVQDDVSLRTAADTLLFKLDEEM